MRINMTQIFVQSKINFLELKYLTGIFSILLAIGRKISSILELTRINLNMCLNYIQINISLDKDDDFNVL